MTTVDSTAVGAFTRNATGIVREAKTRDAFYYNVMWSSVLLVFAFFWILYPFYYQGADALLALAFAAALGLPGAFLYAMLAHVMPRTGGDYIFNSRTLHPVIGFMANFSFVFWLAVVYGVYTTYMANYGIGAFSRMMAGYTGSTGWLDFGAWFSTNWGLFITGTVLVVLSALMFIAGGTKAFFRFQLACFILYLASALLTVLVGIFQGQTGFFHEFNSYAGHLGQANAIHALNASAVKGGFAHAGFSLSSSIKAVSVMWFVFGFTYASNYFAGEIRATNRAHIYSIPGAAIAGIILLAILTIAYTHFAGYDFNSKLGFATPAAYGFSAGAPAYPEITAIASGSPIWGGIIILGFAFGLLVWLPQTMVLISRSMFAWSFDRLMPAWLSQVDDRTHSPVFAIIVVTLLAIASTAVYAFTTWFTSLAVLLGLTIPLLVTAVTGVLLPYRRPWLWEASPFNQRWAGIPVLTIVGVLSILGFVGAIIILLVDPGSGTSLSHNGGTVALVVAVFVAAAVIYFLSREIRRRQGIDLGLAYVELPPE